MIKDISESSEERDVREELMKQVDNIFTTRRDTRDIDRQAASAIAQQIIADMVEINDNFRRGSTDVVPQRLKALLPPPGSW